MTTAGAWSDPDRTDAAHNHLIADIDAAPLVPEHELGRYRGGRLTGDPTAAQLDVLRAFSRGLTHAGVAEVVGRSVETVKTQAAHARFLLQAKNTTAACCEAIRRGLIP